MKIKDTVTLGALSGVIGTIPQLLFHYIFWQTGYVKYHAVQLAGSVFLTRELTARPLGLFIGGFVWFVLAAFMGVIIAYLLVFTGKEYYLLKGFMANEIVMFIITYGFIYNLGGAKIVPYDIKTNLIVLLGSIIYGFITPYLINRWGDY